MITVLEPDGFTLKLVLDSYVFLSETRRYHSPSTFELRANHYTEGVPEIAKGDLVLVDNRAYLVGHRDIILTEVGKQSEVWTFSGASLGGLLSRRLILPTEVLSPADGDSHEVVTGDAVTAMRHFVYYNAISPRAGTATEAWMRTIPSLILDPAPTPYGDTHTWSARFQNLMEYLEEISVTTGVGWTVDLDLATRQYVFRCFQGINRTQGQSTVPPIVISPEFGTARGMEFMLSSVRYKNTAYVAGQGEAEARTVVEVGGGEGLARREVFIDARDLEATEELELRGAVRLAELGKEVFLTGQVQHSGPHEYRVNYDIGDVLTVQHRGWGVTVDAVVTEATEVWQGEGYELEVTFGLKPDTLMDVVRQELLLSDPEVRR